MLYQGSEPILLGGGGCQGILLRINFKLGEFGDAFWQPEVLLYESYLQVLYKDFLALGVHREFNTVFQMYEKCT